MLALSLPYDILWGMKKDGVKDIVVLYHAECPDGFAGSYAAWKKLGKKAEYLGVYHNTPPPDLIYGKHVYTIDYSYPLPVVEEIIPKVKSLTIIDHHVSNIPAVKLAGGVMDIEHSGGVLAWKYFYPDKKLPRLFKNIEDIDIWKFKLPYTSELAEITALYPLDYKVWDKMVREIDTQAGLKKYVAEGKILLKKRDDIIRRVASYAEVVEFEGYKCYMVNSPIYTSHISTFLYEKMPPIAIIWSRRGNRVIVSLRSNGTVDVAKIAAKYGGGGHKGAAGFSWDQKTFLDFQGKQK